MNIGQIAKNQRMLYGVLNKSGSINSSQSAALASSKLSAGSLLNSWGAGSGTDDSGDNFFSSPAALQGSVRQIAKRLYDASFSPDAAGGTGAGSAQGGAAASGDQTLQAIQEQLGLKVDSLQQLYQPNQTTLTGNFAQLQALAQSRINQLQTVSLSDEATKKIQDLALQDAKNSIGAQKDGETDTANTPAHSQADRLSMIQNEVQKFAPSKRAAAFNTINRVWENELDRIGAYIKEKQPDWTVWGDKFDVSILDDYKSGVNMWA